VRGSQRKPCQAVELRALKTIAKLEQVRRPTCVDAQLRWIVTQEFQLAATSSATSGLQH
jgi:hypothetical protein